MAKRKSEVRTKPWTSTGRYYDVWIDEALEGRLKAIEGIHEVVGPLKHWPSAYYVLLDPRYDADEVIAEIEALGLCASGPVAKCASRFPLDEYADNVGASLSARVDFPLTNLLPLCDAVETIMARIEAAIAEQSCDTDAQNWLWQVHARIDNRLHYGSWR